MPWAEDTEYLFGSLSVFSGPFWGLWFISFQDIKLLTQDKTTHFRIFVGRTYWSILDFDSSPVHGQNLTLPPGPGPTGSWPVSSIWVWVWQKLLQLPLWFYFWDYCIWRRIKGSLWGFGEGWCWQPPGDKPPEVPQLWQTALNLRPLLGQNGPFPTFAFSFFLLALCWGCGTPSISIC